MGGRYCAINSPLGSRWGQKSLDLRSREFRPHLEPRGELIAQYRPPMSFRYNMSVYHTTYTFHLHTPSSYLISRFSPVATVNVLHHISHHITVITLHVWVTMRYHCICLYTIPPTHSTFTLPPLISSPGSHLWSRSTYYFTYHTTSL